MKKDLVFKCDICKKREPYTEIYPYKRNAERLSEIEFQGSWSYCCFWCFIILKISEKLKRTRYRYAWCRTDRNEYDLMMEEIGEMRK